MQDTQAKPFPKSLVIGAVAAALLSFAGFSGCNGCHSGLPRNAVERPAKATKPSRSKPQPTPTSAKDHPGGWRFEGDDLDLEPRKP